MNLQEQQQSSQTSQDWQNQYLPFTQPTEVPSNPFPSTAPAYPNTYLQWNQPQKPKTIEDRLDNLEREIREIKEMIRQISWRV
jgi:hypothetical protein